MYQSPESREISIVEVDQAGSVLSQWIRMYQDGSERIKMDQNVSRWIRTYQDGSLLSINGDHHHHQGRSRLISIINQCDQGRSASLR